MTATTDAPVRPGTPRAARAVPLTAARLLRIELRRSAMPWILPLIAALFWFDSYRPSTSQPADLGAAHVLEHGPGPHDHRLRAVRGRRGRLDRVAGRPPRHWLTW